MSEWSPKKQAKQNYQMLSENMLNCYEGTIYYIVGAVRVDIVATTCITVAKGLEGKS